MSTPARPSGGLGRGVGELVPIPAPPVELTVQAHRAVAALPLPEEWPGTEWTPQGATLVWLESRRSPHTRRAYLGDLGHYLAWLDALDRDPLQVTRTDVDAYVAMLRRQTPAPSAASLNRRLAALSSWYRYLIDADITMRNPVAAVQRVPVNRDHSATVGLTVAEVRAFLRAADAAVNWWGYGSPLRRIAERDRLLVTMLATLGLRVSEATGLNLSDLRHNAGHRTVVVRGKGGRVRELPVPAVLGRLLDEHVPVQRQENERSIGVLAARMRVAAGMEPGPYEDQARQKIGDPLFAASSGNRLTQAGVFALVRRLAHDARLPAADRISPHSLRHSAATAALANGAALHEVQDLLGHADPRTTRRYDRNRAALDRSPAYRLAMLYGEQGE
ncbi:tyrosine-type recombinase/integrase [Micromonospora chersina]|uniref:tyrosine-type recombinase/integrase n=1 Tax=Micromonospora chersina TaxID=47854 RepID=UPI0033DF01A4